MVPDKSMASRPGSGRGLDCDGPGDKGIDGLILDRETSEIVVLQSYHADTPTNTQGSAKLQQFHGVADYFTSPDAVDTLLASGPNDELKKLLGRLRGSRAH